MVAEQNSLDQTAEQANLFGFESKQMAEVWEFVRSIARWSTNAAEDNSPLRCVLICGETGVGKEKIAEALHNMSGRTGKKLFSENSAAINESTAASELFGHEKGAFTGAEKAKLSWFETAGDGTLFFDEIGDLAPATQVKLLRVLEKGEFRPVGSLETKKVNRRLLCVFATHRDLNLLVEKGEFREDLLARISRKEIHIPPLRARETSEVKMLAQKLAGKRNNDKAVQAILEAAIHLLFDKVFKTGEALWPRNVRQVEQIIEDFEEAALRRIESSSSENSPNPKSTSIATASNGAAGQTTKAPRVRPLDQSDVEKIVEKRGILGPDGRRALLRARAKKLRDAIVSAAADSGTGSRTHAGKSAGADTPAQAGGSNSERDSNILGCDGMNAAIEKAINGVVPSFDSGRNLESRFPTLYEWIARNPKENSPDLHSEFISTLLPSFTRLSLRLAVSREVKKQEKARVAQAEVLLANLLAVELPRPTNLAVELPLRWKSLLFGRDMDVARIAMALLANRNVWVCGQAGIGKTTLAMHAAAMFVELSGENGKCLAADPEAEPATAEKLLLVDDVPAGFTPSRSDACYLVTSRQPPPPSGNWQAHELGIIVDTDVSAWWRAEVPEIVKFSDEWLADLGNPLKFVTIRDATLAGRLKPSDFEGTSGQKVGEVMDDALRKMLLSGTVAEQHILACAAIFKEDTKISPSALAWLADAQTNAVLEVLKSSPLVRKHDAKFTLNLSRRVIADHAKSTGTTEQQQLRLFERLVDGLFDLERIAAIKSELSHTDFIDLTDAASGVVGSALRKAKDPQLLQMFEEIAEAKEDFKAVMNQLDIWAHDLAKSKPVPLLDQTQVGSPSAADSLEQQAAQFKALEMMAYVLAIRLRSGRYRGAARKGSKLLERLAAQAIASLKEIDSGRQILILSWFAPFRTDRLRAICDVSTAAVTSLTCGAETMLCGDDRGVVRMLRNEKWEMIYKHQGPVFAMASVQATLGAGGSGAANVRSKHWLASGSDDATSALYALPVGGDARAVSVERHKDWVNAIAWFQSAGEDIVVSAGDANELKLRTIEPNARPEILTKSDETWVLALAGADREFYSGHGSGKIFAWSKGDNGWKDREIFKDDAKDRIYGLAPLDRGWIASVNCKGVLRAHNVSEVNNFVPCAEELAHHGAVRGLATWVKGDDWMLATGGADCTVRIWRWKDAQLSLVAVWCECESEVRRVAVDHSKGNVYAACEDGRVYRFSIPDEFPERSSTGKSAIHVKNGDIAVQCADETVWAVAHAGPNRGTLLRQSSRATRVGEPTERGKQVGETATEFTNAAQATAGQAMGTDRATPQVVDSIGKQLLPKRVRAEEEHADLQRHYVLTDAGLYCFRTAIDLD